MLYSTPPDPEETARRRSGLFVMRLLYFLYFAGVGVYFTFINVYLRSIGFSGAQIGLVNTLAPLTGIFAATLWGVLNDRWGRPRSLFMIAVPGVIISALIVSTMESFLAITLMICVMTLFNSALVPIMDNTTLQLLGENRGQYGLYRVGGSFGFIITSFAAGYILDITGLHALFYGYAIVLSLYLIAATRIPVTPIHITGAFWKGLGVMLRQPAWLLFVISAFLVQLANNGVTNFIGVVIQDMGGSSQLIGIAWMVAAFAEIPVMLTSERMQRKLGHTRVLLIAFGLFILRNTLLALMAAPGWMPFITPVGGLAFSLFWTSSVNYANESAPANLKSTAQGLLFSLMNLAAMSGSLAGGFLLDEIGSRGLFIVMAVVATVGLLVFAAGRLRFARQARAG